MKKEKKHVYGFEHCSIFHHAVRAIEELSELVKQQQIQTAEQNN